MRIDYDRLTKGFRQNHEDQKRRENIERKMLVLEQRLKRLRKSQRSKSRPKSISKW